MDKPADLKTRVRELVRCWRTWFCRHKVMFGAFAIACGLFKLHILGLMVLLLPVHFKEPATYDRCIELMIEATDQFVGAAILIGLLAGPLWFFFWWLSVSIARAFRDRRG